LYLARLGHPQVIRQRQSAHGQRPRFEHVASFYAVTSSMKDHDSDSLNEEMGVSMGDRSKRIGGNGKTFAGSHRTGAKMAADIRG
jgi:hypothetical protein